MVKFNYLTSLDVNDIVNFPFLWPKGKYLLCYYFSLSWHNLRRSMYVVIYQRRCESDDCIMLWNKKGKIRSRLTLFTLALDNKETFLPLRLVFAHDLFSVWIFSFRVFFVLLIEEIFLSFSIYAASLFTSTLSRYHYNISLILVKFDTSNSIEDVFVFKATWIFYYASSIRMWFVPREADRLQYMFFHLKPLNIEQP